MQFSQLTHCFSQAKPPSSGTVYAAFPAVTGPTFVEVTAADGGVAVKIPQGFAGQTYVVLTNGNKAVNDNTVLAGPALIEVCLMLGNSPRLDANNYQ